uniref:Uncharacterized protein n=1 Tax=Chromera velia CCMP2878 TaxID=1169474 RepID=A0A0G4H7T5_9ALVE|eukprot:Cvel_5846.t1-p1 / transcript=Cvel_5846.t1 / gene=Cvel_5846 / organism=Chromera_velia_CCMP2878 / gene_product=hypothetical protein / transcript_product=hypothetical protein / location=Cvel_scaffold278:15232-19831(-) / protein_length=481 / sequence_SO=supercontig / SO=protein_coding / is_pseudo=false
MALVLQGFATVGVRDVGVIRPLMVSFLEKREECNPLDVAVVTRALVKLQIYDVPFFRTLTEHMMRRLRTLSDIELVQLCNTWVRHENRELRNEEGASGDVGRGDSVNALEWLLFEIVEKRAKTVGADELAQIANSISRLRRPLSSSDSLESRFFALICARFATESDQRALTSSGICALLEALGSVKGKGSMVGVEKDKLSRVFSSLGDLSASRSSFFSLDQLASLCESFGRAGEGHEALLRSVVSEVQARAQSHTASSAATEEEAGDEGDDENALSPRHASSILHALSRSPKHGSFVASTSLVDRLAFAFLRGSGFSGEEVQFLLGENDQDGTGGREGEDEYSWNDAARSILVGGEERTRQRVGRRGASVMLGSCRRLLEGMALEEQHDLALAPVGAVTVSEKRERSSTDADCGENEDVHESARKKRALVVLESLCDIVGGGEGGRLVKHRERPTIQNKKEMGMRSEVNLPSLFFLFIFLK